MTWSEDLLSRAPDFGFPVAGLVDFDLAHADYLSHVDRYREWLAQGQHGAMGYLERGLALRQNPRQLFPKLQSVFAVLSPYSAKPFGAESSDAGVRYARYLRGVDYHNDMKRRLAELLGLVASQTQTVLPAGESLEFKVCVDTSAVLERAWAELTGLGWIGKNTLLIHPKLGSYTFIGIAFLSLKSGRAPLSHANYCGSCDRCLPACPTEAITVTNGGEDQPTRLDARKCVSYLTLEKRGQHLPEEEALLERAGSWVAGCDLCQEVCPFNLKRTKIESSLSEHADDLLHFPSDWKTLAEETKEAYGARIRATALSRIKPDDFKRNLNQAIKNGERSASHSAHKPQYSLCPPKGT